MQSIQSQKAMHTKHALSSGGCHHTIKSQADVILFFEANYLYVNSLSFIKTLHHKVYLIQNGHNYSPQFTLHRESINFWGNTVMNLKV